MIFKSSHNYLFMATADEFTETLALVHRIMMCGELRAIMKTGGQKDMFAIILYRTYIHKKKKCPPNIYQINFVRISSDELETIQFHE